VIRPFGGNAADFHRVEVQREKAAADRRVLASDSMSRHPSSRELRAGLPPPVLLPDAKDGKPHHARDGEAHHVS